MVGMPSEILIRRATNADVEIVAYQRAAMFVAMGTAPAALADRLASETCVYLREAIPRGEYVGWLASPARHPGDIVAGAGVQIRRTLPFPRRRFDGGVEVALGRQGIVLNVYTEPAYRRQGIARRLMQGVLAWSREAALDSLVLHAAADGRPLYQQMGFVPTNEMRFTDDLTGPGGSPPGTIQDPA
jgi:GNAT superfamily N-acetyltransferase